MLFDGALDGRSEICPLGSSRFQPLGEVDQFKVHWARAEAKARVDQSAAQDRAQQNRRRNLRLAAISSVAVALAVGAGVLATWLAIHKPWKDADELAFADISMDPPVISVARAQRADEELIAWPGRELPPRTATPAKPVRPGRRPGSAANPKGGGEDPSDPDGLAMRPQFDMTSINAVVASKQKSLVPCFEDEVKRTPGLAEKIPLEFVVGNDGRVSALWIDNPRFKTGPLHECLFAELKKWPFKTYEGERASVSLSFNIGKKH
jgi:hypothetical protein